MKKLLAIILVVAMMLPIAALADLPDVTGMTDQELKDLISACSKELMARNTVEPEGIVLFDEAGIRLYQTGDAYIERGRIKVPCAMYNDLDIMASVSPINVSCNSYSTFGYSGSELQPHSWAKCELDFATSELELKSLDEVISLLFSWQIYSLEKPGIVYEQKEREEHRFW